MSWLLYDIMRQFFFAKIQLKTRVHYIVWSESWKALISTAISINTQAQNICSFAKFFFFISFPLPSLLSPLSTTRKVV